MNILLKSLIFAGFSASVSFLSFPAVAAVSSMSDLNQGEEKELSNRYEQRGIVRDASDLHIWLSTRVAGVDFDTPIAYTISEKSVSGKPNGRFLKLISDEVRKSTATHSSKVVGYDDPAAPGTHGASIGDTNVMQLGCMDVRSDGVPATAEATFTWSYQFRDDSNGDGTKDSNPGWVITGVNFRNINTDQQTIC